MSIVEKPLKIRGLPHVPDFSSLYKYSSACSLTVVRADTTAAHVGRVVVKGDVPLPAAGPAVEHHYVVLRPAD